MKVSVCIRADGRAIARFDARGDDVEEQLGEWMDGFDRSLLLGHAVRVTVTLDAGPDERLLPVLD